MVDHESDSPPPGAAAERRREERVSAAVATVLEVKGEDRSALLRDLSVTGAMCLTRARLSPGEAVRIRVYTKSDMSDPLLLDGKVARAVPWDDGGSFWPFCIGLSFDEPATAHVGRIREIAERQAALGLAFGKPSAAK